MFKTVKNLTLSSFMVGVIFLAGCAGSATSTNQPPAPTEPIALQPVTGSTNSIADNATASAQSPVGQPTPPAATAPAQKPATTDNRVDVIYFHMNQRCVTCLCFEQHVTHVIETYFTDAIDSGKLTYKVLNAQDPQNAAIANKYKVVGPQLCINSVVNGFDNIEDIQDIWNWNCTNNPGDFELKVRDIIEMRLKGLR